MADKKFYHPGEICPTSGIYRLVHHDSVSEEQAEIPLTKGERFPPCRNCENSVEWELVREAKLNK